MPPGPKPPIPVSCGRIAISGTYGTSSWTNVFHVLASEAGTPTLADWTTVVQDVLNSYQNHLMPLQHTASHCAIARGVYIPSAGTELVAERTSTTAGSVTGNALPANVASVLSWIISAYYRGGKPRTYIPAQVAENTDTVQAITTAWQTVMQSHGALFLADVNAISTATLTPIELTTVAFARHNAWLATPYMQQITGVAVHKRLDSQRRRLGKETS